MLILKNVQDIERNRDTVKEVGTTVLFHYFQKHLIEKNLNGWKVMIRRTMMPNSMKAGMTRRDMETI